MQLYPMLTSLIGNCPRLTLIWIIFKLSSSCRSYTAMENEYVYFQHNEVNSNLLNGQTINLKPSGQRINTKPSVSVPLQTASAFFTPKLSLQHTQYFLTSGQPILDSSGQQIVVGDTSISRTLPIFSADSGLFFERNLDIANTSLLAYAGTQIVLFICSLYQSAGYTCI